MSDPYEDCEALGHDSRIHEGDDGDAWVCDRCGADGWGEPDEPVPSVPDADQRAEAR